MVDCTSAGLLWQSMAHLSFPPFRNKLTLKRITPQNIHIQKISINVIKSNIHPCKMSCILMIKEVGNQTIPIPAAIRFKDPASLAAEFQPGNPAISPVTKVNIHTIIVQPVWESMHAPNLF